MHCDDETFFSLPYRPVAHGSGTVATLRLPSWQKCPRGHGRHCDELVSPVELPMLPAGHAVHAISPEAWPEDAQKPPSWQRSQLVLPGASLNVPGVQASQLALPLPRMAEKEPGEHEMQLLLLTAPTDGRIVPAGQGCGDVAPRSH